eukprot:1187770-Prorocentrum_minimum.AAC.7
MIHKASSGLPYKAFIIPHIAKFLLQTKAGLTTRDIRLAISRLPHHTLGTCHGQRVSGLGFRSWGHVLALADWQGIMCIDERKNTCLIEV